MSPQMSDIPMMMSGVMLPKRGRNSSPAIKPDIKALTPSTSDKNISCFFLLIKKRFFPFLIFKVSSTILNVIMKQRMITTTLGKPAKLFINVPPSSDPSQYISPCPAAKALTNSMLVHHP